MSKYSIDFSAYVSEDHYACLIYSEEKREELENDNREIEDFNVNIPDEVVQQIITDNEAKMNESETSDYSVEVSVYVSEDNYVCLIYSEEKREELENDNREIEDFDVSIPDEVIQEIIEDNQKEKKQ